MPAGNQPGSFVVLNILKHDNYHSNITASEATLVSTMV
jgi:hypothetical protein